MQQKTDSHGYWSLSKFLKYKATKRIAPFLNDTIVNRKQHV